MFKKYKCRQPLTKETLRNIKIEIIDTKLKNI